MNHDSKYSKLKLKYKTLKGKYSKLKRAYEELQVSSQADKNLIQSLKSDLDCLELQSSPLLDPSTVSPAVKSNEYSTFSSAEKIIRTPNLTSSMPMILKSEENFVIVNGESYQEYFTRSSLLKCDQLNLLSPNPKKKIFSPQNLRPPSSSSGKTPQANPDQSLNLEQSSSFNLQAFFVVGISKTPEGKIGQSPNILFSYITDEDSISKAMLNIIPDLCFPLGIEPRKLKLSGSQSDLNCVLYGQVPSKRNENCFFFTLRAEEASQESFHPDLPNSEQEILYFICIRFYDLALDDDQVEWVVPKVYLIASYIPIIDLHFEFLTSMLLLKRLNRTNIIGAGSGNISDLIKQECCRDEILQLDSYSKSDSIFPGHTLEFGINLVEGLHYPCPKDLSTVDIEWLCVPLFTSLKFNDFFWLVLAVLQEKSVVFVSKNLGMLSSCVVGILALIRPFKWTNLMVPIIPNSLREVLDAPVPLVAGIPHISTHERQGYPSIIWVLLDEPNIGRRIQGPSSLIQEVAEPEVPQLKSSLHEFFKAYEGDTFRFASTAEEKLNSLKISKLLKTYFTKILDAFKNLPLTESNLTNVLVSKFPIYDHKFIRAFSQTLVFHNKLQTD